jgi:hypothetical protein
MMPRRSIAGRHQRHTIVAAEKRPGYASRLVDSATRSYEVR